MIARLGNIFSNECSLSTKEGRNLVENQSAGRNMQFEVQSADEYLLT